MVRTRCIWLLQTAVLCCIVAGFTLAQQGGKREVDAKESKPIPGAEVGPVMDRIVPGKLVMDPPTLQNLGFRWYIQGDSNRNASVAVSYREKDDTEWHDALPMLRVHHEIANQAYGAYRTGNLFAGSILFLEPDTEYEVRLLMQDPDGGAASPRTALAKTRAEPNVFDGGRKLHVYPRDFKGKLVAGSFQGLMAAHDAAHPGDILLLHAGTYKGPYTFTRSGEPGKPIVFRGGIDGEAILEGTGHEEDLLNIDGADYLTFENVTFRRARTAIFAGRKGDRGASGLVVRWCKILDAVSGLVTGSENSANWYIADNVITGFNPTWYPRPEKYMSPAHTGVNIYGRGHVVCYNRISRYSDALAIYNFGPPVDDLEKHCVAIDFYNNDLSWAQDDCMEADYGCHNIRVYRNRCYNAHTGLSVQPSYGGPIYLIRNEVYGVTALTFKLHNYCMGMEVYNNTVCSARSGFQSFNRWQNGHFRNNLFLGGKTFVEPGGRERHAYAMTTGSMTPYTTMDYNGYRRNAPGDLINWFDGLKGAAYATLADFTAGTGYEQHGIMVDYDIFANAGPPEISVTSDPTKYDLRLKPGAVAADAGCALPNVTDAYTGKAPDMGCYEIGRAVPHYGPRGE